MRRLRLRHDHQPPQLDRPTFTGSGTQIACRMAEAAIFGTVVIVMIKMEGLAWQHRQPAPAAGFAVRLRQQSFA
jgi:hypothetical protein